MNADPGGLPTSMRGLLAGRRLVSFFPQCATPPRSGAHVGLWQRLDSYAALGAEVHLVSPQAALPRTSHWSIEAQQATEKRGVRMHLAPAHFGTVDFWWAAFWQIAVKKLGRVVWPKPDSSYFWRPQLSAYWRRLLRDQRFDLAVANYANWCHLLPVARDAGALTIVEMHDLLFQQYEARYKLAGRPDRSREQIEDFKASEIRRLRLADLIISVNAEEGETVRQLSGRPVLSLANGLQEPAPVTQPSVSDFLVVGSAIEHNQRGLRDFIRGAWPVILKQRPDARLTVCGGVGAALSGEEPNVTRIAFAPDLGPHYAGARVVVLTTVAGSGIKIKALEAMSYGACILAHHHSVSALAFQHGIHGEVVEDLAQAGPISLRLLADSERRRRLGDAALALFRQDYSFEASVDRLGAAIAPLLSARKGRVR